MSAPKSSCVFSRMLQTIFHDIGAQSLSRFKLHSSMFLRHASSFFAHLVSVLGSEDFLPPVSMLLIEKVANRVVRQNNDDVQGSLALALSVLQQSPLDLQVQVGPSVVSPKIFVLKDYLFIDSDGDPA